MSSLTFSLLDYRTALSVGRYAPPDTLSPYYEVDPCLYLKHGTTDQRRGKLNEALVELRRRTGREYFEKTYPLQARTLDYSARTFPAYRFILPEVMTEDWLAIMDWGKFQRDHVLHQPLCGYVVLKLLGGDGTSDPLCVPDGGTLLDACVDRILRWEGTAYIRNFLLGCGMREDDPILDAGSPIARNVWRIFFLEAAYVAAVFHDLGYPWQYAERLQGNLDGMNAPVLRQNRSAAQVVAQFGHRLLFDALRGYQKENAACPSTWRERITQVTDSALSQTHGFPGALGFLHLNDCVRRYPSDAQSPLHLLCVEWAAVAIMMHDMSKIYWGGGGTGTGMPANPFLRLRFDRDPLSALVTLVDVIEDFERPAVSYGAVGGGDERVRLTYDTACAATDLKLDTSGVLTVHFAMVSPEDCKRKLMCLPKDRREYFDVHHGYLDMSSLGINEVRLLAT
jgi:hypothetical protein